MAFYHPEYPGLEIRAATKGENAKAGAFYVTKSGRYLSHIAKQAYASGNLAHTLLINKSKYNQNRCVYREESTNCYTAQVAGSQAEFQKSWSPGAWVSLCKADRGDIATTLNLPYQVIWVPPTNGKEPWELSPGATPPPYVAGKPKLFIPTPEDKGISTAPIFTPGKGSGGGVVQTEPGEPVPVTNKAGFPWWVALILGGTIVGTVLFVKKKKKNE